MRSKAEIRSPKAEEARHKVTIKLGNLTGQDAQFFEGLVKLFADPANAQALEQFRAGEASLLWETASGEETYEPIDQEG